MQIFTCSKVILFFLVLYCSISYSNTLLLPELNYDFEKYLTTCKKAGYICTQDYFFTETLNKPTPLFDDLINSIDLASDLFIQNYSKKITVLIKSEMITLDQLEMLLKLCEQVKSLLKNKKQLELIENDLAYLKINLTENISIENSSEFVVIFKKKISYNSFKKLKPTFIKPLSLIIQYDKIPQNSSPLYFGECETAKANEALLVDSWQILSSKSCSLSEDFNKAARNLITKTSEHKSSILIGALAVGAVLYLNKYEISFQF